MKIIDRTPRLIEQLAERFTAPLLQTDTTGPEPVRLAIEQLTPEEKIERLRSLIAGYIGPGGDPVRLAEAAGLRPGSWQAEVLRVAIEQLTPAEKIEKLSRLIAGYMGKRGQPS